MQRNLIVAYVRQLYDKGFCTHPQSEPKATQSIQALNSNIIRLSWLRYLLISLRYMKVPEHSIPQTWMIQQK